MRRCEHFAFCLNFFGLTQTSLDITITGLHTEHSNVQD
jgi:hypothetical protein